MASAGIPTTNIRAPARAHVRARGKPARETLRANSDPWSHPVGLFLAGDLQAAGCRTLILERDADPASPLKALPFGLRGLTQPTTEALDRRGLLAPLREGVDRAGLPTHWRSGARRPAGHFAGLQFYRDRVDGDPRTLAVTIADLDAVLGGRACDMGVVVERGCSVDTVKRSADGVVVGCCGRRFAGGWLVGCDGARSAVRKVAGIGFAGTEPEFTGYSMVVRSPSRTGWSPDATIPRPACTRLHHPAR